MPARTRTLLRQVLGSGFIASNLTLRLLRSSSGFIACTRMVLACATLRNGSPTMACRQRASTTRRGIVIVIREVGLIRRSARYSTIRLIGVSVFGASRRSTRSWLTLTMSLRGMRHVCGGVMRQIGSRPSAARMKRDF
jgi:hypothetical protein